MGHGKTKKQQGGMGKEPKETKEQRRKRIAEGAEAREECFRILPYVVGGLIFIILCFGIYVHTLPPTPKPEIKTTVADTNNMGTTPATPNHMIPPNTFINYDNDNKVVNKNEEEENEEEEEDEPVVVDLDGEEL